MPLAMAQIGQIVRLLSVRAGKGLRKRLADMGLVPGTELEVVQNSTSGPFIIRVKDSRIVLGRGMAHKIIVE